jgi:mannose-6-phosphate isomerase-like protein (cupin superfamily)
MKYFLGLLFACVLASTAQPQDNTYRIELKRADLTGTNMEVITSLQVMKPGDVGFLHIHHGEEAYYFIEGGMVETLDGCLSRWMISLSVQERIKKKRPPV